MVDAHVDAPDGVTGEMLLGALLDAGASVERVEAAVRTLGVGPVRLTWARVDRGGVPACTVRVRAPQETPDVATWDRIHAVLAYTALAEPVRHGALEATRRLWAAEAEVAGVPVEQLDLPPVRVLDTMALVVAVCTAVHDLDLDPITIGPIGVGTGTIESLAGPYEVPSQEVVHLLAGFDLQARPVAAELTSVTGAALVATLARRGSSPPPAQVRHTGVGAGPRHQDHEAVLRVLVS